MQELRGEEGRWAYITYSTVHASDYHASRIPPVLAYTPSKLNLRMSSARRRLALLSRLLTSLTQASRDSSVLGSLMAFASARRLLAAASRDVSRLFFHHHHPTLSCSDLRLTGLKDSAFRLHTRCLWCSDMPSISYLNTWSKYYIILDMHYRKPSKCSNGHTTLTTSHSCESHPE